MRRAGSRRAFLVESSKILVMLLACLAVLEEVREVRRDVAGSSRRVALAEPRYRTDSRDEGRDALDRTMLDCAEEIHRTTADLVDSLGDIARGHAELKDLVRTHVRQFEGSVERILDTERSEVRSALAAFDEQEARIRRITDVLSPDPGDMKRKMILPVAQLRGNGTVGSGVIVYSEPQQGAASSGEAPAATFVLTAYHVVVEVLGDRLSDGVLDEVHVLLENEPDTSRILSAKLVVFDRARDIALLRLNTSRRFPQEAQLAPSSRLARIDVFTRAYAVGCPLGNRPLPTLGEISSMSKVVGDQVFWMLSAPTFFGNSGGGIYLADTYELIGISSMIYTYGKSHPAVVPHMGLFVPLGAIYEWLDGEGYSFVRDRRPIPPEMLWRLVYLDEKGPVPRTATSGEGEPGSPRGGRGASGTRQAGP